MIAQLKHYLEKKVRHLVHSTHTYTYIYIYIYICIIYTHLFSYLEPQQQNIIIKHGNNSEWANVSSAKNAKHLPISWQLVEIYNSFNMAKSICTVLSLLSLSLSLYIYIYIYIYYFYLQTYSIFLTNTHSVKIHRLTQFVNKKKTNFYTK